MQTLLSHPDLDGLLALALTFVAGMVIWLTLAWNRHHRAELEASLKQDMLNRGMSADDIVRVLSAGLGQPQAAAPAALDRVV